MNKIWIIKLNSEYVQFQNNIYIQGANPSTELKQNIFLYSKCLTSVIETIFTLEKNTLPPL